MAASAPTTPEPNRRLPRQTRARETLEAIFAATVAIIERDGAAALTTNRVAEQAGIAIGTLYGYFSNKQAIVLAMAQRELEQTQRSIADVIAHAPPGDIERFAIRALIGGFGGRPRVRRVLLQALVAEGRYEDLAQPVQAVARAILERIHRRALGPRRTLTPAQLFVLTRAVVGVIRAAALEASPLLGTPEFEDELVALTRSYVTAVMRAQP